MVNDEHLDTLEEPHSEPLPRVHPLRPYLMLALECDRPSSGGARHSLLDLSRVIVGRGPERSVVRHQVAGERVLDLRVPGRYMSTVHAHIERVGQNWILKDNGSTNGSFVLGERVDRRILVDGDIIDLGRTVFVFRAGIPTPPQTPPDLDSARTAWLHPGLRTLVPALAASFERLAEVARTNLPVVVIGATGVGKEVAASAVHALSERAGPFIAVNCGAVAPSLLESQFFGYARGAFSGAIHDEIGFVRAAHQGTLFLDEIGALPLSGQAALLRVLQEGEVTPLGRSRCVRVDVRIVAASHEPLSDLVCQGRFREDLHGRLEGIALHLPPLAERIEDMGILFAALTERNGANSVRLSPRAGRLLCTHPWPRNIRELEHTIRVALATQRDGYIRTSHLPALVSAEPASCKQQRAVASVVLSSRRPEIGASESPDELCVELTQQMQRHGGNISEVARAMQRSRIQVHRYLRRFGLQAESFRQRS